MEAWLAKALLLIRKLEVVPRLIQYLKEAFGAPEERPAGEVVAEIWTPTQTTSRIY